MTKLEFLFTVDYSRSGSETAWLSPSRGVHERFVPDEVVRCSVHETHDKRPWRILAGSSQYVAPRALYVHARFILLLDPSKGTFDITP